MLQRARGLSLGLLILVVLVIAGCGSSASTGPVPVISAQANAGPAQFVEVGTVITLDGSGSNGTNGAPVTYQWSVSSVPAGSAAVLANPTSAHPSFTADIVGTYSFDLVVSDGTVTTQAATVSVNAGAPVISLVPSLNNTFLVQGIRLQSVAGFDITITYDPAVFTSPSLTPESLTTGRMFASNINGNQIHFVAVGAQPVGGDGTGTIASVSFQRLSNNLSPIGLTGAIIDSNGKRIPAAFIPVQVVTLASSAASQVRVPVYGHSSSSRRLPAFAR